MHKFINSDKLIEEKEKIIEHLENEKSKFQFCFPFEQKIQHSLYKHTIEQIKNEIHEEKLINIIDKFTILKNILQIEKEKNLNHVQKETEFNLYIEKIQNCKNEDEFINQFKENVHTNCLWKLQIDKMKKLEFCLEKEMKKLENEKNINFEQTKAVSNLKSKLDVIKLFILMKKYF